MNEAIVCYIFRNRPHTFHLSNFAAYLILAPSNISISNAVEQLTFREGYCWFSCIFSDPEEVSDISIEHTPVGTHSVLHVGMLWAGQQTSKQQHTNNITLRRVMQQYILQTWPKLQPHTWNWNVWSSTRAEHWNRYYTKPHTIVLGQTAFTRCSINTCLSAVAHTSRTNCIIINVLSSQLFLLSTCSHYSQYGS